MHLWIPDIPVAEKLLRSVVVYGFLLASFRVLGKRQLGQMTPSTSSCSSSSATWCRTPSSGTTTRSAADSWARRRSSP